ncbi:hypothetical protein GF340_03850 [Candidatus Peregrinibacteria bacterium]|nr:hypothetical protein [Candidatus Peregrinibacteria bacterium]
MQVLIISDIYRQSTFIQKGLQYENLATKVVLHKEDADYLVQIPYYDGVFIYFADSGFLKSVLEKIKKHYPKLPIFLLADHFSKQLKIFERQNLINYFYIRPFSFRTLAIEMKIAVFQNKEFQEKESLMVRDLQLDLMKHEVKHKNQIINLRNKEFALLHFLMSNKGIVLNRSTILENVWDRNANIFTNTVDVHVSQLRKKIEDISGEKYIHTIPCAGYVLK